MQTGSGCGRTFSRIIAEHVLYCGAAILRPTVIYRRHAGCGSAQGLSSNKRCFLRSGDPRRGLFSAASSPTMRDHPAPPLQVNRAPVLALWASAVAEALGRAPDTALALGRYVTSSMGAGGVRSCIGRAFGDRLDEIRVEMVALAATRPPDELNRSAFDCMRNSGLTMGRQGYSPSRPHSIRAPGLIEHPLKGQTGEHQHGNHRTVCRPEHI
jgi:hypothetical protein